jgi:hypothetical protein
VIRCPWPSCVVDNSESRAHLKSHQNTLLCAWIGPVKCSWPKCSSKVVFKHKYLLKAHLANIHVAPLHCTVTGCAYAEPFGKKYDLHRHISAVHGDSRYLCTVESCESSTIGFARKDKLVKHMREKHDNVRCSLNHCGSVLLDGEQESHLQNFHGTYECAFGACEHGLPSHFSEEALRLHLISMHNVYRETTTGILRSADLSVDKTARQKPSYMRRQLAECQGCLEQLPATN